MTGDNSIIKQTIKAKEETEKANELEQVQLAVISAMMYNNTLTTTNLKNELLKENENGILYGNGYWVWKDNINCYVIEKNGDIEIKELAEKLTDLGANKLTLDGAFVLSAIGQLKNGDEANNSNYIWNSSNTNIVTVTSDGILMCGEELGTATISCIAENQTLTCEVTTTAKIVSTIQSCNNTINNSIASYQNPTIPSGYMAINTLASSWNLNSSTQPEVNNGLVIIDENGNQFVWVPVQNVTTTSEELASTNKAMAIKIGDNYKGLLYNFTNENNTISSNVKEGCTSSTLISEPDTCTNDTNDSLSTIGLTLTEFKNSLQLDYNEMIKSIIKYGGFWVGRYETSYNLSTETVKSIAGVESSSAKDSNTYLWYGLYKAQKNFSKSNSFNSCMIWGSQYDAMMNWMINNGKDVVSANNEIKNKSGITGITNDLDIINNIYDLYGGLREWTMEKNAALRVARGGVTYDKNPSPVSRAEDAPQNPNGSIGSRITLYLN